MMKENINLAPLDELLATFPKGTSDVIPILQRAQAIYGYLPLEVLQHIADSLNISLSKIYGVATFYAQFYLERRGRHVLRICDGTACHVKGAPSLMTAVQDEFGINPDQTTEDGQLSFEIVYCMGSCALAPVAVVDGSVRGRMAREKLLRQVKQQLGSGQGYEESA
jgi:NADH-quinone oxidoreductase subunit E